MIIQKLILLGGSQDFSNENFEILVINGYKEKGEGNGFSMEEHSLRIPFTQKDRKIELLESLRVYFNDGSLNLIKPASSSSSNLTDWEELLSSFRIITWPSSPKSLRSVKS